MADMPWEEQIKTHLETKPYSIDPFNEVGIPEKARDSLLVSDFLNSYGALSEAVSGVINARYIKG